jgi:hypothetical protein
MIELMGKAWKYARIYVASKKFSAKGQSRRRNQTLEMRHNAKKKGKVRMIALVTFGI